MTTPFTPPRHWQQSYDARVPTDINPDACPTVVAMAEAAMQRYASHTAFRCFNRSLSYADVDKQSCAFAAYLQHLGVQRGDRIAVMLPNIPAFPVAMFGILRAGAAQVNVNPMYTPQELLHQLNDAGVQTIVIIASALPTLESILVSTTIRKVIVVHPGDTLDGLVATSETDIKSSPGFPLTRFVDALREGGTMQFKPVELTGDDLLFLQYTGGTTGPSKGAALSHRNLVANIMQARAFLPDMFDTDGDNVVVTALPLFHVFALTINLLICFSAGAENWLIPDARNSDDLVDTLIRARPTLLTGVNTLYGALVRHPRIGEVDFSRLRLAIGGGAAVLPATSTQWKNITGQEILEGYGLSETSAILCLNVMGQSNFSAAVGLPLPSTDIVLLKDDDQPATLGEAGEICAKGPQIMSGYWQKPSANAKAFTADGYFRTGDIGIFAADGLLKIVDRKKDLIIVSGFNVYPNEVEVVVANCTGVSECAVIGMPDERSGESVYLYVVKAANAALDEAMLIEHCRAHLAAYKVPRQVRFLTALPKSTVGKILRRDLRVLATAGCSTETTLVS
ncbi:long-chain-fatty-acid--CoA ligase [Pseudomonas jessenii]|uniref:Long-chain-fatty-acid--CoA ligase n=2 Tax=Pseudomonas TaxID=286 RepID=A0A231GQT9_PSEJE|nr:MULTISPECIES: AMP-binding protein [Pseudomonas]OXR38958.1 long-chain-fatty-acid--CoA ligase [Pseudomonas jessenii]SEC40751.1 long-chain acyl-CoA synthetase [Pseudomonas jessenii]VVQ10414.1 Long-chain-fatty-acid--CoA ligase [Pseudomonas fluorescens]